MTLKQLGNRLGISLQSVRELEAREARQTVSLAKLRDAAEALGCDLQVVLVPKQSLEDTMQQQAALKAREERNKVVHTMRLEAQDAGVEESLDEGKAAERWLAERVGRLWD
jgi:predicted DNA-binding mobile mystery protein A